VTAPSHSFRPPQHSSIYVALIVAACTLCACDNGQPLQPDLGPEVGVYDTIVPPDLTVGDGWPTGANVGAPCDPVSGSGCKASLTCLDVRGSGNTVPCDLGQGVHDGCGVCVLTGCTTEDINTPAKEDNCPTKIKVGTKTVDTICTTLPVEGGDAGVSTINACLPTCVPDASSNPCKAMGHSGLSCDPGSILLNDNREVCLFPACFKDTQCGNQNPTNPDAICHVPSGLCQTKGSSTGKIGGACQVSADCGERQYCFPEQTVKGQTMAKGGYCTLIGCKYGSSAAPHWQCPQASGCYLMGSAKAVSFCLAEGCDTAAGWDKDGCRDGTSEVEGQYDCHPLSKNGVCWLDINSPK
jgi:hypothetical protein